MSDITPCNACGVFMAEVDVGGFDVPAIKTWVHFGAVCWMCAHMVQAHGVRDVAALMPAYDACTCTAEQIYPPDVLARRREAVAAVRAFVGPCDVPDGEIVSGELEDPTQKEGVTFVVLSHSYDKRGRRDEDGPVLEQVFKRVSPNAVELVSCKVRERTRSERISRTMRANGKRKSVDAIIDERTRAARAEAVVSDGVPLRFVHGDGMPRGPNIAHLYNHATRTIERVNLDEKRTVTSTKK